MEADPVDALDELDLSEFLSPEELKALEEAKSAEGSVEVRPIVDHGCTSSPAPGR